MSYFDDMFDDWLDSDMDESFDEFASDGENMTKVIKGNPKPAIMSNKKPFKKKCACGGHQGKRGKKKINRKQPNTLGMVE